MNKLLSEQSRQSYSERITWIVLLILTALFSYKLGGRSALSEQSTKVLAENGQAQKNHDSRQSTPAQASVQASNTEANKPMLSEDESSTGKASCPPPVCPPCDCQPVPPKPKPKKLKRRAPPLKASSPVDRQKLLAWVKRYSPRLKRCRDAGQAIYKLHAQVKLSAKKDKILSVKVTGRDVPASALRCVEYDLKRWPVPTQLSEDHPALLIFGLQLD